MKLNEYCIDCTGNACVGDEVRFVKDILERKPINDYGKLAWVKTGEEIVEGKIIKDSYGKLKQQHTFTVLLPDGQKRLVKGRVLYRNGVLRKKWDDESARESVLLKKYERGNAAREARNFRYNESYY